MYRGTHRNWLRPEISLSAIVAGALLILLGGVSLMTNGSLDSYVPAADVCPSSTLVRLADPEPSSGSADGNAVCAKWAGVGHSVEPRCVGFVPSPTARSSVLAPASVPPLRPGPACRPVRDPAPGLDRRPRCRRRPTGVIVDGGYSSIKVSWRRPAGQRRRRHRLSGSRFARAGDLQHDRRHQLRARRHARNGVHRKRGGSLGRRRVAGVGPVRQSWCRPRRPISATPPDTNLPLDTGDGPISSATPGQAIVLKGDGYAPYSDGHPRRSTRRRRSSASPSPTAAARSRSRSPCRTGCPPAPTRWSLPGVGTEAGPSGAAPGRHRGLHQRRNPADHRAGRALAVRRRLRAHPRRRRRCGSVDASVDERLGAVRHDLLDEDGGARDRGCRGARPPGRSRAGPRTACRASPGRSRAGCRAGRAAAPRAAVRTRPPGRAARTRPTRR